MPSDPSRVIVDHEPGVGDMVIYPTQGGRHRHRVVARKLFPYLYDLKERVVGSEVHRWWGFFGKNRYSKTAALAGNPPVVEHPRTGGRFIAAYYPNHMGVYDAEHQVLRPRPPPASRESAHDAPPSALAHAPRARPRCHAQRPRRGQQSRLEWSKRGEGGG